MRRLLVLTVALRLCAQTDPSTVMLSPDTADIPRAGSLSPAANAILPMPRTGGTISTVEGSQSGVDWSGLFRASSRFLAVEHGFRLLTEPGTRSGLSGSFFDNYARAVGNLHGWADGDEFYVNYVGHPMQGSVAGFLWVHNDRSYRAATFGRDRLYWRSRLRATAFAWAYSEQFEIGPFSEASIGGIQSSFPEVGFVDQVITPSLGLAWMLAEDALDRYVVERIESAIGNPIIRLLCRMSMNPSRTFANVLQGGVPWRRDTRAGVLTFEPATPRALSSRAGWRPPTENRDVDGPAPFELAMTFQPERFPGGSGVACIGGGGAAAIRMSQARQLVFEVKGCNLVGLGENLSGDSLTYMAGPRFRTKDWGRWSADLQFLVGGNKLTQERMFPEIKKALETAAARDPRKAPPAHDDYTEGTASNGVAVSSGGGVNYKLNGALTLRVAELAFQHSWAGPLWGRSYSDTVKLSSGLVLRIGTW